MSDPKDVTITLRLPARVVRTSRTTVSAKCGSHEEVQAGERAAVEALRARLERACLSDGPARVVAFGVGDDFVYALVTDAAGAYELRGARLPVEGTICYTHVHSHVDESGAQPASDEEAARMFEGRVRRAAARMVERDGLSRPGDTPADLAARRRSEDYARAERLQQVVDRQAEQIRNLDASRERLLEQAAKLGDELGEARRTIAERDHRVADLEQALHYAEHRRDELVAEVRAQVDQIDRLRRTVDALNDHRRAAEELARETLVERDELRAALSRLALDAEGAPDSDIVASLRTRIAELSAERDEYRRQVEEYGPAMVDAVREVADERRERIDKLLGALLRVSRIPAWGEAIDAATRELADACIADAMLEELDRAAAWATWAGGVLGDGT